MNKENHLKECIKQKYISFGPSCLAAEILKACNMRFCTLGFDWFRSGSYHHSMFFRQKLNNFLKYQVYNLSAPLRQIIDPNKTPSKTSEIKRIEQLYGYDVLYNPHRKYDHQSFQYFKRAFQRLDHRLNSNSKEFSQPTLLMADYINKQHYIYFENTEKAAAYLRYNCLLKYGYMPSVRIVRFKLVDEKGFIELDVEQKESDEHIEYTVPISHEVDKDTVTRRVFYQSLYTILT